jgi:putative transposase
VFVERLWRSVKYEEVYLHVYETVSDVRAGLDRYLTFFNHHTRIARGKRLIRLLGDEVQKRKDLTKDWRRRPR